MITPDDGEIYTVRPNFRFRAVYEANLTDGVVVSLHFHRDAARLRQLGSVTVEDDDRRNSIMMVAPHPVYPRIDALVASTNGYRCVVGIPAVAPVPPVTPSGTALVARIRVEPLSHVVD